MNVSIALLLWQGFFSYVMERTTFMCTPLAYKKGEAFQLLPRWFLCIRSTVLCGPIYRHSQSTLFGVYRLFEDAAFAIFPDKTGFSRFTASYCGKVCGNVPAISLSRCKPHLLLCSLLASRETISEAIATTAAATSSTFDIVVIDFRLWAMTY